MTVKAARTASKRGYKVVALIGNSPVAADQGLYSMTATYRGFDGFAQAGNRQALDTGAYLEAKASRAGSSKYGGGLFKPTTEQGRAVDAAIASVFRGY